MVNEKEKVSLAFMTEGGAGNLFVQLNFIYCVYQYLKDEETQIIVFGHQSKELNELLMKDADFIKAYYPRTESMRGYDSDAFIDLEFFPDVLFQKAELKGKSEKIYRLLEIWKTFMKDTQRRYALIHPIVNYNAYIYAMNNSKMVLDVADIQGIVGVEKDYQWRITIQERKGYLESLDLNKEEYITIQRGATPDSFQTESTKLWPISYYEKLISLLKKIYPEKKFVQVGQVENSKVLSGIDINLLGKTTWEQLGVLLQNAWLHIDGECGMVHFRRMLTEKPSVVLFGPTPMDFYGYKGNINIQSNACMRWCARLTNSWSERCIRGYERPICMSSILPGKVAERIVAWDCLSKIKNRKEKMICFKNAELYKNQDIQLDLIHRKMFLDSYKIIYYERDKQEVEKLRVFCVTKNGYDYIPVKDTAAYKALAETGGWAQYESYIHLLQKGDYNQIHSCERFKNLVETLEKDGYSDSFPVLVDADNHILDGQHRAAWKAYKFGTGCNIEVIRIYRLNGEDWDFIPYERISRESRVIIYGSGAIGESYVKQIDDTKYCKIVAILDRNPNKWNDIDEKRKRIKCLEPSAIKNLEGEYDYIIIASRGGKNMRDMRKTLLEMGVEDKRIISYIGEP